MEIPSGITYKFIVTPSILKKHQESLKPIIINALIKYFRYVDVTFYDRYKEDNTFDSKLKGKQMLVKIFCPEPNITIRKKDEKEFYEHLKKDVAKWIIDVIQSNIEKKYKAKLEQFLFTYKLVEIHH